MLLLVQKICTLVLYTGTGLLLKAALERGFCCSIKAGYGAVVCPGRLLSAVLAGLQLSRSESRLWHGGFLAGVCLGAVVWRHAGQAGGRFFFFNATWMLML